MMPSDYLAMRQQARMMAGELYALADGYGHKMSHEEWDIVKKMGELSIKLMSKIKEHEDRLGLSE